MSIQVYNPGCTVTLFKMVQRKNGVAQRYAGLRRQIDLTPFLAEMGTVETSKSVDGSAAGGGFTVSFPDQPDNISLDTVYATVEPMDMIEIRMSRNPGQYAGAKLPLVMRGFISTVSRPESMGADGLPVRSVVLQGIDFTKLWLIQSVYWQALYATDSDLLSFWQVGAALGMPAAIYNASDFVSGMVAVMNRKVQGLAAFAQQTVEPFSVAATVKQGTITPNLLSALGEGTYWDIMSAFADKPWNELFIQDLEAGPQVVYRPVPYKDTSGNFILPDVIDPGTVSIDISQIVSLNVSRTDDNVANVWAVSSDASNLLTGGSIIDAALANGNTYEQDHPNNLPTLYGTKVMTASSNLVGDLPSVAAGPGAAASDNSGMTGWWVIRYTQLEQLNHDNSVWESGSATVQGLETLRAGMYLAITRGSLVSTFYVTEVDHSYSPFGIWTSTVTLIRGDGFLVRDKYAGNAFWAEGRKDVYGS